MNSSPLQFAMGDGSVRGVSWSVSIPPYIERVELMIVDAPVAGPTWVSLILPDIEEFLRYRLQYPTETEQIVSIPPYNYEEFFLRGDADDRPTEEVPLNFTRVEFMFVDAPVAGPTWVTLILPDRE